MRATILILCGMLVATGAVIATPEAAATDCEQPRNGNIECDIAGPRCFGLCTLRDRMDEWP